MASVPSSSSSSPSQPKTRKKPGQNSSPAPPPQTKWRTGTQERLYSRRLVDALRATRDRTQVQESVGSRAVKEAADSALALTARGQSRWSRAILFGRNSCRRKLLVKAGGKIRRHRRKQHGVPPVAAVAAEPGVLKEQKVKERLRKLGRLVPGCRKLPAATLLEEAADYVAALELQVRTMRALADALSAAAVSAPEEEETKAVDPMAIAEQGS
ncbi:Transcription factor bHLH148 [Rhynchospora pubera]|uniref:Transcription factor bHLH148 n=1 Tax=Rhynchospora pubera TaxID=906938 RepID=A0AAV8FU66_9POAL|nr:Transcription factor bHLH148 [Rhynchospora pubera]